MNQNLRNLLSYMSYERGNRALLHKNKISDSLLRSLPGFRPTQTRLGEQVIKIIIKSFSFSFALLDIGVGGGKCILVVYFQMSSTSSYVILVGNTVWKNILSINGFAEPVQLYWGTVFLSCWCR